MYDVILVGTDGSEPANRAVEHALSLAEQYGAEVHVLSVVDTGRYGEPALSSTELVVDDLEDQSTDLLVEVEERAADQGVDVVTTCCHGNPHEKITAYADEIDADLTLLGSHGRSQTGHHIGSVADRVTRTIERPVLLT
ncbi:universal stress protein [Natrinema sp. 1APR25-10V2]|uniref:universal stress protein n=1 Tax=Natrinema sp. 1APR25-10V2 TaxID=2951081 RepID=UPI0028766D98|nr:universal stress protein [Natrinema sp. 1APR25-10V2]MDS0477155.1 universal stress protein [Natrinema sp. 1APR25-10V2]